MIEISIKKKDGTKNASREAITKVEDENARTIVHTAVQVRSIFIIMVIYIVIIKFSFLIVIFMMLILIKLFGNDQVAHFLAKTASPLSFYLKPNHQGASFQSSPH